MLRAGAGDPAAPAVDGVWSELSEAIDRAIEKLRQQDAVFENLDQFVDVDFANFGQVLNDQAFQTGVSALMRTGNTGAVTDALQNKVLIDSIRFKSPILFHSASNPFDGEFSLGVSGISPDGVRGIDVHGSISTTRPFVWGAFTIEQFGFNLGITHEFGTNRPAFNAGVDFRATW